jgi:hypothetical protein
MLEIVFSLMSKDVIDIIGRGRLNFVNDKGRLCLYELTSFCIFNFIDVTHDLLPEKMKIGRL